jgi:hypothetical protein
MSIAAVDARTTALRLHLAHHRLYRSVGTTAALRCFMAHHVAAVWDFMALVKRLQRDLTCVDLAFRPPVDAEAARFVLELVLGEEADLGPDGAPISHLQLYLRAMAEVGAPTGPMEALLDDLRAGVPAGVALAHSDLPAAARAFSAGVLHVAEQGSTAEVAAHLLWGREDPIPMMFTAFLEQLPAQAAPTLRYYLQRHVDLDGDEHGPLVRRLVARLAGDDAECWARVSEAACEALRARLTLWDATLEAISGQDGREGVDPKIVDVVVDPDARQQRP